MKIQILQKLLTMIDGDWDICKNSRLKRVLIRSMCKGTLYIILLTSAKTNSSKNQLETVKLSLRKTTKTVQKRLRKVNKSFRSCKSFGRSRGNKSTHSLITINMKRPLTASTPTQNKQIMTFKLKEKPQNSINN